nr:uncharacterized protein CI109_002299 [Kwoniella shandongensis]KAA5529406.1 hypothetical protein CI109_002299 [Kwoniella shandongensis]
MSSKNIRYALITIHTILIILTTLISVLLAGSFTNFIPHIVACGVWATYIPTAILLPFSRRNKGERTRFDCAQGEMTYVVAQGICWFLSLILSALQADSRPCHEISSYKYAVESEWIQFDGVIWNMGRYCHTNIATAVLSGIHLLFLAAWVWVIVRVVKSWRGTDEKGWKVGMWRLVRGEERDMGGRRWRESQEGLNKA